MSAEQTNGSASDFASGGTRSETRGEIDEKKAAEAAPAKMTAAQSPVARKPDGGSKMVTKAAVPKAPPLGVQDTVVLVGVMAGAQLSAGYNYFFGRNAGRNVIRGRYNIIIGDDEFGKDVDGQRIIAKKLPHIEDFQLATTAAAIQTAAERIRTQCAEKHDQEALQEVFRKLGDLHTWCILRLRLLEHPAILQADKHYLEKRFPEETAK